MFLWDDIPNHKALVSTETLDGFQISLEGCIIIKSRTGKEKGLGYRRRKKKKKR